MNKFIGVGRLCQDVDVKYTQSGKCVANFTIAINRPKTQDGKQEADFIPVVAWNKLAETCGNYIGKGSKVLVEGRVQVRSYEANDGQKKRVTEVIAESVEFLDSKKQENSDPFSVFGQDVTDEEISF